MTFQKKQSGTVANVAEEIFVMYVTGMMKLEATVVFVADLMEQ
jgi:hypothetical protein